MLKFKIAIITTTFLEEFFIKSLRDINAECEFTIHTYNEFSDILEVYKNLPKNIDGILTSGSFPTQVIKKNILDFSSPIASINVDEAAIYRLFFTLLHENRNLDLSRVYIDSLSILDIDATEYLLSDQKTSYTDMINYKIENMTLDELYNIEHEELAKHISLWDDDKIDFCITRFSSIVPKLKDHGINVYFSYPSIDYIKSTFSSLLKEINVTKLRKHQPAAINISIAQQASSTPKLDSLLERQYIMLQEALLDYNGNSSLDYILKRYHFGFEILTEREKIKEYTTSYTKCTLKKYLEDNLPFEICIGYGIGNDMYQARMNAIDANRESLLNTMHSTFLIDDNNLIGPLDASSQSADHEDTNENLNISYTEVRLSPITVRKVISAINSMANKQITSRELSTKLSITQRSANRFLSELERVNIVEVIEKKRCTTKGRPERVYGICAK